MIVVNKNMLNKINRVLPFSEEQMVHRPTQVATLVRNHLIFLNLRINFNFSSSLNGQASNFFDVKLGLHREMASSTDVG